MGREKAIQALVEDAATVHEANGVLDVIEAAGLTVVEDHELDRTRATARRALAVARRLLNTHGTERKGGPLVSRLSSGEFTARMNELATLERELG